VNHCPSKGITYLSVRKVANAVSRRTEIAALIIAILNVPFGVAHSESVPLFLSSARWCICFVVDGKEVMAEF